jgi:hypothetical protein
MSIKHRLVAGGSLVLMAAGLVAFGSAEPAFAYSPGYICSDSGYNNCLLTHGSGNTVTVPVLESNTTNFSIVGSGTWVEYQQVGTNLCLEWEYENSSGTVVNVVRMATCSDKGSELWNWTSGGMIENEAYPGYYGTQGCMYAPGPSEDLYVEACNVTIEDQFFFSDSA